MRKNIQKICEEIKNICNDVYIKKPKHGIIDIKQAVMNNNKVYFRYYREKNLYYQTEYGNIFSVPIDDLGSATFNHEEKALLFMRYMRKHNKMIEKSS